MLTLKNIVKDYVSTSSTTHALKGISISFRQNEFVSILGPSGCGKTTTLNIIGGLDRYTSGDLLIKGQSTKDFKDRDWDTYRNHSIGFVFQTYNLIPHLNILGNVELALTIGGVGKEERQQRALVALEKVGLANEAKKRPNQLSGGQMQRVAIARALVNDPEILLADEPTGALDSVTSVQIMELLKEVAKERLVIMVTHNPELAHNYSTRIVQMKDGEIIGDSNPFDGKYVAPKAEKEKEPEIAGEKKKKERKSKMNWPTTFMLSAKNLWAKARRTALVCVAGSIGIIGVSAVLAVTTGVRSYIGDLQDDMLSGNPVTIQETGFDLSSVMNFMTKSAQRDAIEKSIVDGKINIDYMIEYLADTRNKFEESLTKNNITPEYVKYVEETPRETFAALRKKYGINQKFNIYTDWEYTHMEKVGDEKQYTTHHVNHISLKEIEDIYVGIVKTTRFATYASMIPMFTSTFDVMPDSTDYVLNQYDILNEGGYLPTEDNEMMIVVDKKQQLTDLFLAQAGFYTQDEFVQVIDRFANAEGELDPNTKYDGLNPQNFDYSTILNKKFTLYKDDDIYTDTKIESGTQVNPVKFMYNGHFSDEKVPKNGKDLKITAIVRPKDDIQYGCLKTGFVLSNKFDEAMIKQNENSNLSLYLKDIIDKFDESKYESHAAYQAAYDSMIDELKNFEESYLLPYIEYKFPKAKETVKKLLESTVIVSMAFYDFSENFDPSAIEFIDEDKPVSTFNYTFSVGTIGENVQSMSIIQSLMGSLDISSQLKSAHRSIAGESLANSLEIYPNNFDEKYKVTERLDAWNGDDVITIHNALGQEVPISRESRTNIRYMDNLEIVINIINALIDVISIALLIFTSLSLVVSTVMIGIITYVSVVERVKEIGIIRSLGGRKIDVSNLFNVETFIIGGISGLFGLLVTYIIAIVGNIIIKSIAAVGSIIYLPWYLALAVLALSITLTLISGLIPARVAAKKDPVVALRTGE